MSLVFRAFLGASVLALAACDSDSNSGLVVPSTYNFDSQFVSGESSVSYQGQVCRQVLITALKNAIKDQAEIQKTDYRGAAVPYYDDTIAGDLAAQSTQTTLGLSLPVAEGTATLGELCGTKHLDEKFAGNDTVTDHKDWTTEFAGVVGQSSAEAYLRQLLNEVSVLAASGASPAGAPHYVSADGIDYAELIQKFLLMAVPFSQGTDDYLDDATDGKGLKASAEQSGEKTYSGVEHAFDEGFGYFGAARDYASRSDETNRSGVVDDNSDGIIDLNSEHNFAASTNAAKRDEGSDASAKTDFTGDTFSAFLLGRATLTNAATAFADMTDAQQAAVLAARDAAVEAWEAAIAATVVHYINDTLGDMDKIGTGEYSFATHAKHFSEMKGFALGLQFNPKSPLHVEISAGESRFERLHTLLRDKPALTNETAYRDDLLAARALMGEAYGFATVNLENW